jgi:hypothetical protein
MTIRFSENLINRFIEPKSVSTSIWGENCWSGCNCYEVGLNFCPLCSESSRGNLVVSIEEGSFECKKCRKHGGFVELISLAKGISIEEACQLVTDIVVGIK